MPSVSRAPARLSRVATATGLMLAAAVMAHVAAGGAWPLVDVLVLLGALLAVLGAAVTRIGPRRPVSLLLVGVGQYVAHQVLAVTSHWSMTAVDPSTGHGAGHGAGRVADHGAGRVADHGTAHGTGRLPDTGGTPVRHPVTGDVLVPDAGGPLTGVEAWFDGTMALAHLAATVAVGLVLATGDRAVAAARSAVRARWWREPVPSQPVPVRPLPVLVSPVVVPSALVCVARRPRRGPPQWPGVARLLAA